MADHDAAAAAIEALADYAGAQGTTGLLALQAGRVLVERNWPPPASPSADEAAFAAAFARGATAGGAPIEDVASQQKSLVALLAAQAFDRGLMDPAQPVSDLIGPGWSRAGPAQERAIAVRHLLEMTSGLTEALAAEAPPGARFAYNTPAYARLQRVLEAAAGAPLDALTRDWLTGPLGMADTAWRPRPAALAQSSGNAWGLVTCPRDLVRLGAMVMAGGLAPDGARLVSAAQLAAVLTPTATNPAYGRLWWLNGGAWSIDPFGARREGPYVPTAPPDLVLALGAQGRVLGVAPSRALVVARLGRQPQDPGFAPRFWALVMAAADAGR